MKKKPGCIAGILIGLSLFVLSGCGVSNSTSGAGATAKLSASLAYPKTAGKSVALAGDQVVQARLVVTGPTIPTAKRLFTGSGGGTLEVYPGSNLIVTALAYDSGGTLVYEGAAVGQTIAAGDSKTLTIQLHPPVNKTEDKDCLGCHENTRDITGQNLIADYKQSGHYTNTSWTANAKNGSSLPGCSGCHGTQHNDLNPAASGRCFECHATPASHESATSIAVVNSNPCSDCHQMHNTKAAQTERKGWVQSGHGNIASAAWAGEHIAVGCNRCHTSAGFTALLATYSTSRQLPTGTSTQPDNLTAGSLLGCSACHTDFASGALRTLRSMNPATTYTTEPGWRPTGYALNYGKLQYPDVAGSNLCITCHDFRNGDPGSITGSSTTEVRPHFFGAAATMYLKMGFLNLSTGTAGTTVAYLNSLKSSQDGGSITSTHRKLGTPVIIGDTHKNKDGVATFATVDSLAASGGSQLTANGPCVACHLTGSHTLKIDQKAIDAVCSRCHSSENGFDISTQANFQQYFLDPQREVFANAILLGISLFNGNQTSIDLQADPDGMNVLAYSRATSLQASAADWSNAATGIYANKTKLLGAASNLMMFSRERGSYVHARAYTRRLLYDTLDYLDDGILNMSVGTTAISLSQPGQAFAGVWTKGVSAYTVVNGVLGVPFTGTSESMLYLIGWSRTYGTWSTVERP